MRKGYIYRHWIVNDKGQEKSYIGQTAKNNPRERWRHGGSGYIGKNGEKKHKFARAIKKYGWDNFHHEIIGVIECEEDELFFWLNELECYYIEKYDSYYNGYNSTMGGEGCKHMKHSEETKEKLRKAQTGKKASAEARKAMSEARTGMKMKPHSEEAKKKISESRKGKCMGKENGKHKNPGGKPVLQYADKEHSILINTYPSMEKALHSIGMIGHTQMVKAIKDNTIYKGYYWSRQE